MKILISVSSIRAGKQIAKDLYTKFTQDRKRPTKNEFTTSVKVGYTAAALIDGPTKGMKTKVRLVGSYYQGKSLAGTITYPLNALAYDNVAHKAYVFNDGHFKSELSDDQFVEASAVLRDFIDGSSESLDSFLIKLSPDLEL